jgi:acyl-CoA reductase-like NAD-dependent aldehyde dehydrogenase
MTPQNDNERLGTVNSSITHNELFIGGRWVRPRSTDRLTIVSPNTEQAIGSVPHAGAADVDAAVDAARAAFTATDGWPNWAPAERAAAMRRLADALESRIPEMARRVSSQNGMPITLSTNADARRPVDVLRYYADLVIDREAEHERPSFSGGTTLVRRLPLGVAAAVVPFNFPQTLAAYKYAPALAAGCTVVLKPSPETVLDSVLFAEAVRQAGLPPGVINIVPGGQETGAHLIAHPGVNKVAFTGSTTAGRQIGEICGRLLRPVTMELGGKSAGLILDDFDLTQPQVAENLIAATLANNGQTCFLSTRILAPQSRYDEVVEFFAELATSLIVGDSLDPATQVGPLVTEQQRDRVERFIHEGRSQGARLVTGGRRPAERASGATISPSLPWFPDRTSDRNPPAARLIATSARYGTSRCCSSGVKLRGGTLGIPAQRIVAP